MLHPLRMFEFIRDILKVVSPKEENERDKLQRKEGIEYMW